MSDLFSRDLDREISLSDMSSDGAFRGENQLTWCSQVTGALKCALSILTTKGVSGQEKGSKEGYRQSKSEFTKR